MLSFLKLNDSTNLNGLIELDISALEIPTCLDIHDINTFLEELYLVQWEEFRLRTIICKNRLQSSISSSNAITLLGWNNIFPPVRPHTQGFLIAASNGQSRDYIASDLFHA
jgi:hypothetical protein